MASTHIFSAYDDDLKFLSRRISEMGGLAEQMVSEAVRALVNGDTALAQKVISDDVILDHAEREIGDKAIVTIARRQPMASDLREIMGSIRIAADLERVGDLGKNTAKRVIAVQSTGVPRKLARGLEHLSELALVQLKEVLDVYTNRSADKANAIRERDNEIDAMYTSLFRELLTYMMEDPRNITSCTHLLFCAKNIERIGDHATNIAETIYYMTTGAQPEGDRPKDDSANTVGAVTEYPPTPRHLRARPSGRARGRSQFLNLRRMHCLNHPRFKDHARGDRHA